RIEEFDSNGSFLRKWGSSLSGPGQLKFPVAAALDGAGNVYVLDSGNNRVQKFSSDGVFITAWDSRGTEDNGSIFGLGGIGIDGRGAVYVTDPANSRVQKFDGAGNLISTLGTKGTGRGQFLTPSAIAVDAAGNVYVGDPGTLLISKFDS